MVITGFSVISVTWKPNSPVGRPAMGCGRWGSRVGNDLIYEGLPAGVSVIAFYPADEASPDLVMAAVKELVAEKLATPAHFVTMGNQVTTVADMLGGGAVRASNEDEINKGKLQVALHLGAWPNGKRLTQDEKNAIRRQLGLVYTSKPRPWAAALQQSGLLGPGQKWWAPTSEGRRRGTK